MAATYTPVSLEEMETYLKRAFRALRPKQGVQNRETYYDLAVSPTVVIRVWTSIGPGGSSAGVGEDAIRVQFFGSRVNRPLVSGKAPIVKRTQNWRNSLQDRIEEYLEMYEEKADYWDARGGAEPGSKGPAASAKQVNFILSMASRATEEQWGETGLGWPPEEDEIKGLVSKEASRVIDVLLQAGLGRRYASAEPEQSQTPPADPVRAAVRAAIANCNCGEEKKCFGGEGCEGTGKTEGCEGACKSSEGTCPCGKTDSDYDFD
jgi:hypothetical protein